MLPHPNGKREAHLMFQFLRTAVLAVGCSLAALPALGQEIVPAGTKAVLTVEYKYVSAGERKDKYDTNTWSISRVATVAATLKAEKPMPMPGLHKMDDAEVADLQNKQVSATRAAQTMQPMMQDVMALMAKCGEDEACLEREVAAYGLGNSEEINKTREKAAPDFATAAQQGPNRYQMWSAMGRQTGSYEIAEKFKYIDADPICMELPGARCTTTVERIGRGQIPLPPDMKPTDKRVAGAAMLEVDSAGKTMIVHLPVPMMVLAFGEQTVSNDPETKNGSEEKTIYFPALKDTTAPLTIPLTGGLIGKSGRETINIKASSGEKRTLDPTAGEDGELVILWSFSAG